MATRRHGYYLWNVFLPTFLLTILAGTTYAVPRVNVAERLGVVLTLLLTSVAFKFVVAQGLPKISYNTCLDCYVLISFIFLTAAAWNVAGVAYVANTDEESAADIETILRRIFEIAFALWHVITLTAILVARSRRTQRSRLVGPSPAMIKGNQVVVDEHETSMSSTR